MPSFKLPDGVRWGLGARESQFAAQAPELEPIFRDALLVVLASTGAKCEVVKATPWPDIFAFEFQFSCIGQSTE